MKILNIVITIAVILAVGYGLFLARDKFIPKEKELPEVPTIGVKRGDFVVKIREVGTSAAKKSVSIYSSISGKVIKLCPEGNSVKKGDFLAQLDPTSLEKDVREKQLTYEQAQADVKQVEEELGILNVSSELNIKTQRSQYQYDKTELEVAKANLDRQKRLYKEQIVTLKDVESEESTVRSKEAAVKKDELDVEISIKKSSSDILQKKAQVNLQKVKLEKAKMDYELAKKDLAQTTIKSPADGLVVYKEFWKGSDISKLTEGDDLHKGSQIMEIPNMNTLIINLTVRESDVNLVKPGQKVTLEVESAPEKQFIGKITSVNMVSATSRWGTSAGTPGQSQFPVTIEVLKNIDNILRPGMNVTSNIIIKEIKNVISLPLQCIFSQNNKKYVWVKRDNGFEQKFISVGEKNEDSVEIKSGIDEGDRVALKDPFHLNDETENKDKAPKETPIPAAGAKNSP